VCKELSDIWFEGEAKKIHTPIHTKRKSAALLFSWIERDIYICKREK